eukprot:Skav228557  [mRNA]  locus=scaffold1887:662427:674224:- [translate_table: standard]
MHIPLVMLTAVSSIWITQSRLAMLHVKLIWLDLDHLPGGHRLELQITDGPLEGTFLTVIPEAGISRFHCEITFREGQFGVKDLGSTTGSFFYLRPHGHFQIFPGLMVKLGETEMQEPSHQGWVEDLPCSAYTDQCLEELDGYRGLDVLSQSAMGELTVLFTEGHKAGEPIPKSPKAWRKALPHDAVPVRQFLHLHRYLQIWRVHWIGPENLDRAGLRVTGMDTYAIVASVLLQVITGFYGSVPEPDDKDESLLAQLLVCCIRCRSAVTA